MDDLMTPTLDERVAEEVDAVKLRHGYLDKDGVPTGHDFAKAYDLITDAVVTTTGDRAKIGVSKRAVMRHVYPDVVGPEAHAEQPDPDLSRAVYERLAGQVWRWASVDHNGQIQKLLNGNGGLILCRTSATPDKTEVAYVTSDLKCLLADFSGPQKAKIEKATKRMSQNLAMAVQRLPQFADTWDKELKQGMKTALGSGQAILQPALDQVVSGGDGDE